VSHTPPTRPATASAAIGDLLRGAPRPVHVLAAFRAAVYLGHDDGVVALVAADGIHHPNAVVDVQPTADVPFAGVRRHQRGRIGDGRLELPRRHLRVVRWFDPVPRPSPTTPADLDAALGRACGHLATVTDPLPADLAGPLARLTRALAGDGTDAMASVRELLGRGPGLTPAGDDLLAGLLAATAVLAPALPPSAATAALAGRTARLGDAVALAAPDATTAVSAALLRHARDGAVAAPAAAVLHALAGRGPLAPALDRLLAVGSTSGRDLAVGLLVGADLVLATTPTTADPVTATHPRSP
jgi:hypothetical protein